MAQAAARHILVSTEEVCNDLKDQIASGADFVFSAPVGEVQGPVQTQFGYHLVEVTSRED